MRLVRSILALAALACLGAARPAPAPAAYTVSPVIRDGGVVALDVSLVLHAGPDGRVTLHLPDASAGVTELWRYLQDFKVEGATSVTAPKPAERLIQARPGAPVTVRYRVVSAYEPTALVNGLESYKPQIFPSRFWVYGEALFAYPSNTGTATFRWTGAPPGFGFASDLERPLGQALSLDDVIESVSVGGPDLTIERRELAGAPVRVASLGRFDVGNAAMIDMVMKVISGERAFWGGREGPFLVVLDAAVERPNSISIHGEGRADAFVIQAGLNTPVDTVKEILAHEYFHTWNPRRLGGNHDGDAERADYWFSEGFTDFYARRLSLRSGVFSLDEFLGDWNRMLGEYAASPNRAQPNARIVADFWKDEDVKKLPYRRGAILAATWDAELRARSGGKVGLDEVMRAMRDRAAALGHASPKAPQLFIETARGFGLDVSGDLARIVEAGAPGALPADAFGGCVTVRAGPAPVFELGYEVETRRGVKVLSKVDPQGPAYAAGLREGMTVHRVSGYPGDPAKPWKIWVGDGDTEWPMSFLPAGKGTVIRQQLELPKDLTPEAREACARTVAAMR